MQTVEKEYPSPAIQKKKMSNQKDSRIVFLSPSRVATEEKEMNKGMEDA